jgi:hypothetical protein
MLGFTNVTTDADGNVSFELTLPVPIPANRLITATATDSEGNISEFSNVPVVVIPPGSPSLSSVIVNDGALDRSQVKKLTVSFDRPVTLQTGAITLVRLNTGGSGANNNSAPTDASSALAAPTTQDGGKTWVYTFAAASPFVDKTSIGASTGSLVDGIYTLSVDPTKVAANGVAMTTGGTLTFHRLFGDINGTKNVNAGDYNLFRGAFGKNSTQAGYNAAFDFDNNGTVNAGDYNQFRARFGKAFTY